MFRGSGKLQPNPGRKTKVADFSAKAVTGCRNEFIIDISVSDVFLLRMCLCRYLCFLS